MPKPGEVVGGKYEIEEMVGEGGMGAVFAARHRVTEKRVALKWMHPDLAADEDAVERFVREARAAGRIDHPNVVDIYDVGEHGGSTFLVMELLRGENLAERIEGRELKADQVIQILLPAMRGVAAAHRTGVIHRDLKPENIFLCRDPDGAYRGPKVLDFGISKVSSRDGSSNHRLTKSGMLIGTPYYMAPEQIRGRGVDQRADVYAFGVILYEALTGRVPFNADNYGALVLEIANATPARPSALNARVPHTLERVVLKAMAREPGQRYADIESLARALEPFARGESFAVTRPDPTERRSSAEMGTTPLVSEGPVRVPIKRTGQSVAVLVVLLGILGGLSAFNVLPLFGTGLFGDDRAGGEGVQPAEVSAVGTLEPPPGEALAAPDAGPAVVDHPPAPAPVVEPPDRAVEKERPRRRAAGGEARHRAEGTKAKASRAPPPAPPPPPPPAPVRPPAPKPPVAAPAPAPRAAPPKPAGRTGAMDANQF